MLRYNKIKIGKKTIEALAIELLSKNFILIKGSKGYIMCGYLDLSVANKFNDVAVKVTGVSSIKQALKAKVHSCSKRAKRLGIYKGQPVKEALKLIS